MRLNYSLFIKLLFFCFVIFFSLNYYFIETTNIITLATLKSIFYLLIGGVFLSFFEIITDGAVKYLRQNNYNNIFIGIPFINKLLEPKITKIIFSIVIIAIFIIFLMNKNYNTNIYFIIPGMFFIEEKI